MIYDIVKRLEGIQGANFGFKRTDYSWQSTIEYTIHFEMVNGGDTLRVVRTGDNFEALVTEAWEVFEARLMGAFKPAEMGMLLEHKTGTDG